MAYCFKPLTPSSDDVMTTDAMVCIVYLVDNKAAPTIFLLNEIHK